MSSLDGKVDNNTRQNRQTTTGREWAKIQKSKNKAESQTMVCNMRRMLESDEHKKYNKDNLARNGGEYIHRVD